MIRDPEHMGAVWQESPILPAGKEEFLSVPFHFFRKKVLQFRE